jgi:hypothetical protein
LKFPDRLTISALDAETRREVPEVAFVLVLRARQKNDYFVGPVITDRFGKAVLSRGACERAIARAQEMFVMDYARDLLSCKPMADLRLHSPQGIATMISQYEAAPDFWGKAFDDPQEVFPALRSAANALFEPLHLTLEENNILDHPEVVCFLRRKQ